MKIRNPMLVGLLVTLVVLVVPPELQSDPSLYVPVFAIDGAILVGMVIYHCWWWRNYRRQVDELARQYGPEIYLILHEAMKKRRRGS